MHHRSNRGRTDAGRTGPRRTGRGLSGRRTSDPGQAGTGRAGTGQTGPGRTAATLIAIALAASLCTATAPAATAADTTAPAQPAAQDVVLPPPARFMPREEALLEAGATGYLHTREGLTGKQWTDYATGETKPAPAAAEEDGHSGLRAKVVRGPDGTTSVAITDLATGSVTTLEVPQGHYWAEGYTADSIVTVREAADGTVGAMSILRRAADGTVEERAVTGIPASVTLLGIRYGTGRDAKGVLLAFQEPGKDGWLDYALDYGTGHLTRLPEPLEMDSVVLGERHMLMLRGSNAITWDRRNPEAAPITTTVPDGYRV
ncbi:hypothetical protein ACFYT4_27115 [Streptomyces sp. NPDC004609]|uniref:hypothetical protein n=1 Tax=Streptomyces sp. NPDC004609 TaxID=3364704 RepID=UPI0036A4FC55